MFLPFCAPPSAEAYRQHQRYKLDMMKAWRDSLEARLAALNAAISTVEQQLRQDRQTTLFTTPFP
ncbi:MAG TPA: hypothetical protein VEZ50_12640 [Nodosilinea sp.]|nr:hypothetical protein [Nodosilinea sp.]